ncbi:MAG: hypothetical protein ACT4NX_06895 [Deltaproteobacteria bacterium]
MMQKLALIFIISGLAFGENAVGAESNLPKRTHTNATQQSEIRLLPLELSLSDKKMPIDFMLNLYYANSKLNRLLKSDPTLGADRAAQELSTSINREELIAPLNLNTGESDNSLLFLIEERKKEPEKLFSDFSKKESIFIPLGSFIFIKQRF